MKTRVGALLAVLLATFAVPGCVRTQYVLVPTPPTADRTQQQQLPAAAPTTKPLTNRGSCAVGELSSNDGCEPCEKLKPCYIAAGEMHFMVEKVFPTVYGYARSEYDESMVRVSWMVVPTGQTLYGDCGPMYAGDLPTFCETEDRIYLGEDALWAMYEAGDDGGAIALIVMSHEYAHHIQHWLGVAGSPTSGADRGRIEKQADCFSGAATKYYMDHGQVTKSAPSVIQGYLSQIGANAQGSSGPHGTPQERINAFSEGLAGLDRCNSIGVGNITP